MQTQLQPDQQAADEEATKTMTQITMIKSVKPDKKKRMKRTIEIMTMKMRIKIRRTRTMLRKIQRSIKVRRQNSRDTSETLKPTTKEQEQPH